MKTNDKVLAGLLVSLGLFSAGVASRYVANMTSAEKEILLSSFEKTHSCPVQTGSGTVLSISVADSGTVLAAKVAWTA